MKAAFTKKNASVSVTGKLSEDRVKLFLDVESVGGPPTDRKSLLELLSDVVKPERLDLGVIDDIVRLINSGEKISERRVAKGKEPGAGINGKLVYLVRLYTGKADVGEQPDKQNADLRELNLFDNIAIDQHVARLYPPRSGEAGEDAFGQPIAAPIGKEFKLSIDKSLVLHPPPKEASYQILVSKQNGYLFDDKGQLKISPELVIKGDVDFHIGNVRFIGKIKVTGDVQQGFRIEGQEGVEVVGSVNAATIIAKTGDIIVKGLAVGGAGCKFLSGKAIRLTRAQELSAEAKEQIIVEKEARDCDLRTQSTISGSTAWIHGGRALAVCGIEAKGLGNEGGKQTDVFLCADVETSTEFLELAQSIEKHDKAIELLKLSLGPFADQPQRIQFLKPDLKKKMETMHAKFSEVIKSRQMLETRKTGLLLSAKVGTVARVSVHDALYNGVRIHGGGEVFRVGETAKGPLTVEFNWEQKTFVQGPFKPAECVLGDLKQPGEEQKK